MSVHERGRKPALKPDADALVKVPPAPRHLGADARAEWKRAAPELVGRRILTTADLTGLETYCIAVGIIRQANAQMQAAGGIIDPKLFGVLNRAAQTARQLAAEYGLSPTSRSRLGAVELEDDDADNPLAV